MENHCGLLVDVCLTPAICGNARCSRSYAAADFVNELRLMNVAHVAQNVTHRFGRSAIDERVLDFDAQTHSGKTALGNMTTYALPCGTA